MIKPFLEGKTMSQAMDGKKLFIVDLAILEDCPTKRDDLVVSKLNKFYIIERVLCLLKTIILCLYPTISG